MLLSATGITLRYGAATVLDGVALEVRRSEILGLIGPNGAGKTTLFECLAGLIPCDAGSVACEGELFYLPDGIRPWPEQPVRWALHFFEALWRRPRGAALEFARGLQLVPLLDARIGTLSKGETKRVLLALGLLTPHPLLLLDEPFDGLDFRQTRDVMALLRTLPAAGRTLFVSIHQLNDAARLCERFVLLSRGRVVGCGTLDELRAQAGIAEGGLEEVFLALT
ncbi:MAG: ABC transporter ATP-binding protein [Acidobacteria bacterium]|nr:ABC transporter ATP-binding protein [Acidobacteriota bacterium]